MAPIAGRMRSIPDRKNKKTTTKKSSLVQNHKAQNPLNPWLSDFEAGALTLFFATLCVRSLECHAKAHRRAEGGTYSDVFVGKLCQEYGE